MESESHTFSSAGQEGLTLTLYGSVPMLRGACPSCKDWALVLDGAFACCGIKAEDLTVTSMKVASTAFKVRRKPGADWQEAILEVQQGFCFWCLRLIGTIYERDKKLHRTVLHWDHIQPWIMAYNNEPDNFVASCNLCNLVKSKKIFKTITLARSHITDVIRTKGIRYLGHLPKVPQALLENKVYEQAKEILQSKMQERRLGYRVSTGSGQDA